MNWGPQPTSNMGNLTTLHQCIASHDNQAKTPLQALTHLLSLLWRQSNLLKQYLSFLWNALLKVQLTVVSLIIMFVIPFLETSRNRKMANGKTKINFLMFFRRLLMFIYVSNQDQKFFWVISKFGSASGHITFLISPLWGQKSKLT